MKWKVAEGLARLAINLFIVLAAYGFGWLKACSSRITLRESDIAYNYFDRRLSHRNKVPVSEKALRKFGDLTA